MVLNFLQLKSRDLVEQDASRFSEFEVLYSHTPIVQSTKQGLLELRVDGVWKVFWFVLDDNTHSLCWYNTDVVLRKTVTVETIFLQHLAGVAAIPMETAIEESESEPQQESNAVATKNRLRLFQFCMNVAEKVMASFIFFAHDISRTLLPQNVDAREMSGSCLYCLQLHTREGGLWNIYHDVFLLHRLWRRCGQ